MNQPRFAQWMLLWPSLLCAVVAAQAASFTVHTSREAFVAGMDRMYLDTFDNPAYLVTDPTNGFGISSPGVLSDAVMTSIRGKLVFETALNYNNIQPPGFGTNRSRAYCSGCYFDFRIRVAPAAGQTQGVSNAIGLDIMDNNGPGGARVAIVGFGDGSTATLDLPEWTMHFPVRVGSDAFTFWGISSAAGITSVAFTSPAAGAGAASFVIDNLTLERPAAEVPEAPPAALLLGGGIVLAAMRRRATAGKASPRR